MPGISLLMFSTTGARGGEALADVAPATDAGTFKAMIAAEVEAPIVGTSLRSRRRPMSGSFLAAIRQCPPSSTVLSR
jgi:hypothetical protein